MLTLDTTNVALKPYPHGVSQHQVVVRDPLSRVASNPKLFLEFDDLPNTVLGSAFGHGRMMLPTPLPVPHDQVLLPTLPAAELRGKTVTDGRGELLGTLYEVPALFVRANALLRQHTDQGWNPHYDYARGLREMARDAARLYARVLDREVLNRREQPGFMAHLVPHPGLAVDEVGISEILATEVFRGLDCPLFRSPGSLDGCPTWTTRFPLQTQWSAQPLVLRVLAGEGRYVALPPWNLEARYQGDADGDLGMVLLRTAELLDRKDGLQCQWGRPERYWPHSLPLMQPRLSLTNLLEPETIPVSSKLQGRMRVPALQTRRDRLATIHDADKRQDVATYTLASWHIARVLATRGLGQSLSTGEVLESLQQITQLAYEWLEPLIEGAMDAFKGDSAFSGVDLGTELKSLLRSGGGALPLAALAQVFPPRALAVLELAWRLAGGKLTETANSDPIYAALVSGRNQLEDTLAGKGEDPGLLAYLFGQGVPPADVLHTLLDDFANPAPDGPSGAPVA